MFHKTGSRWSCGTYLRFSLRTDFMEQPSGELRGCRRPPVLPLGSDIHSGELVRVFGIGGETDGGGAAGGSENICTANAAEGSKIRRPPPPLPPSLPGLSVGQTVLHDPSYPLICSSIFFCLWGPDRVDPIQADMMPLLCYRRGPRRSTDFSSATEMWSSSPLPPPSCWLLCSDG